ncbi:hypothetical protein [Enterococcus casseliflavus]|uniref:hypothetical protein n=1 Tax=Enterococcus casseliflavus TaxID=37734 RepID=UPI00115E6F46|nr:hypothetical protein [Enterococcus casseliflavus]MCD5161626.1 hypothetical protein [Enterococcus casseliflavus]MCD5192829.1 hypothetical protein [Enterococcus casseliflavus]
MKSKKDLNCWSFFMIVLLFPFVIVFYEITFMGKVGIFYTISLGVLLGSLYVMMDYHFKEAPLSLEINDLKKLRKGFYFKKIQRIVMIVMLISVAFLSFAVDLMNPEKISIEKPSIIFILFFSIKEIYEYLIEAKEVISEAESEVSMKK